jgi:hypothetical protein
MPHLNNDVLQAILVEDFNKFTMGRWNQPFVRGMVPFGFETCDWHLHRKGRPPRYRSFCKHSACHWLVNFALCLAMLAEPRRSWRIITSERHSTVWDGDETIFEFNFNAMGISADECFRLAHKKELKPGRYITTYYADHYSLS